MKGSNGQRVPWRGEAVIIRDAFGQVVEAKRAVARNDTVRVLFAIIGLAA